MDPEEQKNKKPLGNALLVFFMLFSLVVLATIFYDFSGINVNALLFFVATLCCVFVAKNTYDVLMATQKTEEFKKSIAKDLAVSSDELYVQLYKNSPVPYLIIDAAGEIRSANVSTVRMLGESQNNVNGINVFNRIKGEEDDHVDFLREKFRNGLSVSDEMVKVIREDKKEAWALLSLYGFVSKEGEKIGLMTLVDITKQKKAEDAKSEFVSLASHQLRTPIAGMKWSAELLLVDNPDVLTPRQHKYIDRLLVSIKRMAVLVDDFLRVSRFDLGTFQAEHKPVNVTDLFEDILTEQAPRAKQKNVTFEKFFKEVDREIMTDPNLLRMSVTNLITNAIKYSKEDGVVNFSFDIHEDRLTISVTDHGMGIPLDDLPYIFSKLFRASNAVRNVPDGTGLGLYIVKQAVGVLKGNVSFTSGENVGTTFEIVLPVEYQGEPV